MRERRRHPTPEEVEIIIARARRMRSVYIAALISRAALSVKQCFTPAVERRSGPAQRYYHDIA